MTERLFIDNVVLPSTPYPLNPQSLLSLTAPRLRPPQARFATAIVVRYHPNVASSTPGECCIAAAVQALPNIQACQAAPWMVSGPAWKKQSFIIPKNSANFQAWSVRDTPALTLSAFGVRGTITISCTVVAVSNGSLPPPPNPIACLASLGNKAAFFGPRLDGFSFISCIPPTPQPVWTGAGNCMNVSFISGSGNVKSNLYVCSPTDKDYVVVRYGFGSSFDYVYNSANKNRSWNSNSTVIREFNNTTASNSQQASYWASWTVIKGSTGWWAEVKPRSSYYQLNGGMTWYHPCVHLFLYYDFGSTDIRAKDFVPSIDVFPGDIVPELSSGAKPNQAYLLRLNEQLPTLAFSPLWYDLESQDTRNKFEEERDQLARNKADALYRQMRAEELRNICSPQAPVRIMEELGKAPENLHAQYAGDCVDS